MEILLNFFFKSWDIFLFLGEIIIFLYFIFELQIPVITEDAIFPVPINPIFKI
mgnify:FL=1